jgi:hypothetical protein
MHDATWATTGMGALCSRCCLLCCALFCSAKSTPCLMAPCCCCRCSIHFHCPYPAAEAVSSFVRLQAADAIMHTITSRQTSMLAVSATTLCSMLSLLPHCSVRTGGAVQQLYCTTVVASLTCRTTERLGLSCMVHSHSCAKAAGSMWYCDTSYGNPHQGT